MTDDARTRFLRKLEAAWRAQTLVKFTLSQPCGGEKGLRNLYGRVVELREGRRLSLVWRHATRDVTKNLTINDALEFLGKALGSEWERAHLFTTTGDWQWRCEANGHGVLKASRPAFAVAPVPEHDRDKNLPLATAGNGWLQALGVANAEGDARPGMAPKLRQIQRFVELLGHLVDDSPTLLKANAAGDIAAGQKPRLRIVDMGAGKGYLTFATAEFFRTRGVDAEVVGVEARGELVKVTNRVAREHDFTGLSFVEGTIADFTPPQSLDVLIALHACDTATDDALAQAVRAGAALILAAPCCHKEIRAQLRPPPVLRDVLRHGILAEREAEIVTDGIRALLLEMHGYRASVFEFISPEETSKNLMLSAQKRTQTVDAGPLRTQWRALMEFYGLREQRLATLLGE